MIETKHMAHPKPGEKKARRRAGNHTRRNKRRTKRGMVIDLDRVWRHEIVMLRDLNTCQRCGIMQGESRHLGIDFYVGIIQWAHIHTREYYITRWEPDNSLALCSRCHVWFDNHKVLGFDWFAKKFPERWERITRMLQGKAATNDAWVRSLWEETCGGGLRERQG